MARTRKDGKPDRRGAKPGGRQLAFVPSQDQREAVVIAAAAGVPHSTIALLLTINEDTLRKHFRQELDNARELAVGLVTGSVFRRAMDDDHKDAQRAAEFWLTNRGGPEWRKSLSRQIGFGGPDDAAPEIGDGDVKAGKITVEFVNYRPKGLPGAPPEDR